MSHRTDIRQRVVAVMQTAFPANTVLDSYVNMLDEAALPAVVVFGTDEDVEPEEGFMGTPIYRRTLTVRIEFHGGGDDAAAIQDTLEAMLEDAETALYADSVLELQTYNFWLAGVEHVTQSEAGGVRTLLGASFAAQYERAG